MWGWKIVYLYSEISVDFFLDELQFYPKLIILGIDKIEVELEFEF